MKISFHFGKKLKCLVERKNESWKFFYMFGLFGEFEDWRGFLAFWVFNTLQILHQLKKKKWIIGAYLQENTSNKI